MSDPKKFDLQSVINNIKTMISPESNTPRANPDDAIGQDIVELSTRVQQLANAAVEQARELAQVNQLLNKLFKDLQALRLQHANKSE